jgi:hypothetical protein
VVNFIYWSEAWQEGRKAFANEPDIQAYLEAQEISKDKPY